MPSIVFNALHSDLINPHKTKILLSPGMRKNDEIKVTYKRNKSSRNQEKPGGWREWV